MGFELLKAKWTKITDEYKDMCLYFLTRYGELNAKMGI
jgi:hypothetical protein